MCSFAVHSTRSVSDWTRSFEKARSRIRKPSVFHRRCYYISFVLDILYWFVQQRVFSEDDRLTRALGFVKELDELVLKKGELDFWSAASRMWLKPELSDYKRVSYRCMNMSN